jgi:hypothetical protein
MGTPAKSYFKNVANGNGNCGMCKTIARAVNNKRYAIFTGFSVLRFFTFESPHLN